MLLRARGANVFVTRRAIGEFVNNQDINKWLLKAEEAMDIYRKEFQYISRYLES